MGRMFLKNCLHNCSAHFRSSQWQPENLRA